jgi:hypothetical protein
MAGNNPVSGGVYVAIASKSGAVIGSSSASFTSPTDTNLIVAYGTRIHINKCTEYFFFFF